MNTIAIIQARMGSTRLPGKSLMDIAGKPLVWHVVNRVRKAKYLDGVVVAVPQEDQTGDLAYALHSTKVPVMIVPGDPNDLVHRYALTAQYVGADIVVRIPADNPCIDPDEIDRIVTYFNDMPKPVGQWLTTNLDRDVLKNGYPGGLGAEVYETWFLHWLDNNMTDPVCREHPHFWAMANGKVRTIEAPQAIKRPELHFDVNTFGDLEYIRAIYDGVYSKNHDFRAVDIIEHLDKRRLN